MMVGCPFLVGLILIDEPSAFLSVRVGDTFLLGAHDVSNCRESEGCQEVQIIQAWNHEDYRDPGGIPYHDIAVAK